MSYSLFLLPKFAESLTEARVVAWLAAEGAALRPGDPLVLVETDKTSVDVEVRTACVVEQHLVPEGTVVPVGAPLARLQVTEGNAPVPPAPRLTLVAAPPPAREATTVERPVELGRIHAHRARWQVRTPGFVSYLALAVVRGLAAFPELARQGQDARGRLALSIFTGDGAEPWKHLMLEPPVPLLRIEALLREPRTELPPSLAPAVVLACEVPPPSAPDGALSILLKPSASRLIVTGTREDIVTIADAVARHLSEFTPGPST